MESKTYIKNVDVSAKKLRFYLKEIKALKPAAAVDFLYYSPQKAGKVYYKALKSAIQNATSTLKTTADLLQFKVLTIEQGPKLKRFQPGGRGTMKPFVRRKSHIKIILTSAMRVNSAKQPGQKNTQIQTESKEAPKVQQALKGKKVEKVVKSKKNIKKVISKKEKVKK